MQIFLILSIIILAISYIVKEVFYSAKKNLFKDQSIWTGKDIKIKYSKPKEISKSKRNDNYLEVIAEESKIYLENQSNQEDA